MALERLVGSALCGLAKFITGARAVWHGCAPEARQRVYFANHRSHADFVLIWASLPPRLRRRTRPVAGADYWLTGRLRSYMAQQVFRGVLIDRTAARDDVDPIGMMSAALAGGDSLILFPEGTRNLGDGLLPFKSGLYHLACANPGVELVPVWIENLGRVMPKGSFIPVPVLCSLTFGHPITVRPDEAKNDFLQRARSDLLALAPAED